MAEKPPPEEADQHDLPRENDRTYSTQELFGNDRLIWIEHEGQRYRLRITRRNKLILQK